MKILLINSNPGKYIHKCMKLPIYHRLLMKFIFEPPLALQTLDALTPKKHSVKLIDELRRQDTINFNEDCDLVGITSVTVGIPRTFEIADKFRKKGKTVVIGGVFASLAPEEAKKHADSVVIGEAELLWPQLLEDLEKGQLKPFYKNEKPVDISYVPVLNRNRYPKFNPLAEVKPTFGCPYMCKFCSISNVDKKNYHKKRNVDDFVEELRKTPQKILVLCDPSLTIDPEWSKEFFRKVKKLKKKMIYVNANTDVLAKDEEFVRLGHEAGVLEWHVGFESISQASLKEINKKTNKINEFKKVVQNVHKYGGAIAVEFILGFDSDTKDVFEDTFKTVKEYGLDYRGKDVANINILTPFPGTPLYYKMEEEGRIISKDWSKYDYRHAVYQPKNMTPKELEEGHDKLKDKLQPPSDIFKRSFDQINYSYYYYIDSLVRKIGISSFRTEYKTESKILFSFTAFFILSEMFFTMLRWVKMKIKSPFISKRLKNIKPSVKPHENPYYNA